ISTMLISDVESIKSRANHVVNRKNITRELIRLTNASRGTVNARRFQSH
ncbi:HAD family hydrolase, partial [Vibrio sp. V02_P2A34T13]